MSSATVVESVVLIANTPGRELLLLRIETSPYTPNVAVGAYGPTLNNPTGFVIPIPTLPALVILMRSTSLPVLLGFLRENVKSPSNPASFVNAILPCGFCVVSIPK